MAVYKVPQDVEADDKLLGPFSFRQFIYLIAVALGIAAAWGLSRLFLPLFIIPLPVILFFGALALPLRKDQPMEVYLAAIVSYYIKPRRRLWQPDGLTSLVEVTVPHQVEVHRSKDLSQTEAKQRLSYLANVVDSQGWAVRGAAMPPSNSTMMNSDVFYEAQQATDILDESTGISRNFDDMIEKTDSRRRQQIINTMHQPAPTLPPPQQATTTNNPYNNFFTQPTSISGDTHLSYNPYPTSIHQSVIQPLSEQQDPAPDSNQQANQLPPVQQNKPATNTSEKPTSPDIINLANQHDLSIEAIAHEAERIKKREQSQSDEVVISLR